MNKKKLPIILITFVALIAVSYLYTCGFKKVCGSAVLEQTVRKEQELKAPKGIIYAEVVDTQESREKGLSGRKGLGEDEGMLFVFDHPGKYGFWMKDMEFAIDMVWLNASGVVVHVERNISPASYFDHNPPLTFINDVDAIYVLELAEGKAEEYGLFLGTKIIF
jgi:uncharacterized protein